MRTRVKICGITQVDDARIAVDAGADALGLVFYDKSPRNLNHTQANQISKSIPAFVSCVALFKDADKAFIENVLSQVSIDLIQFHGSESAHFCEQFKRPYIKAVGMKLAPQNTKNDLQKIEQQYASAKALLYDAHETGGAGGTGETFDWLMLSQQTLQLPVILAGGLTPENVGQAIKIVAPYGVDVSSGVERGAGIKDKQKIIKFMAQIN